MNAPPLSKINQLRDRDGDHCWLCQLPLDFSAKPNSKRAPTKEHLQSLSDGGTDALDNLVLCHPGCNRQLSVRPRAEKEKMRARRIDKLRAAAGTKSVARVPPKPSAAAAKPVAPKAIQSKQRDWRTLAWSAIATATFFAGLALGLLLR